MLELQVSCKAHSWSWKEREGGQANRRCVCQFEGMFFDRKRFVKRTHRSGNGCYIDWRCETERCGITKRYKIKKK